MMKQENVIKPVVYFTPIFKVKLETALRIVQQHDTSNLNKYGLEVAQSMHDEMYADTLKVLFLTRNDCHILCEATKGREWELFSRIVTSEFGTMNAEAQRVLLYRIPSINKVEKLQELLITTCDRIVDLLNAEFNLLPR